MNEIYRDPKEGALARRIDLLRRRRDELVTMPHAIRRVAVARGARSAAALTAILTGGVTLAIAASSRLADTIASVMPGPGPAPIATCAAIGWLLSVIVYVTARAMHEHRFIVAMSKYVLPGEDLDVDLERLSHERPDDMARSMAHRLEVRSAALPVAAAAMVVPSLVMYLALAVKNHGWASTSAFEEALASHVVALFAIADAGLVAAVLMTRRSLRLPIVAPIAATLAVVVATTALVSYSYHAFKPAWIALGAFSIAGAIAIVVRRLQSERERIETDDPAAGSDMFTWRGFVRDVRAMIAWVRVRLTRRRMRRVMAAASVLAVVGTGLHLWRASHRAAAPVVTPTFALAPAPTPTHVEPVPGRTSGYTIEPSDHGIVVHLHIVDGKPLEIANLGDVPAGWRARVTMSAAEAQAVLVTPFAGDDSVAPTSLQDGIPSTVELCDAKRHHLALHVDPITSDTREITLTVTASLELSSCH